MGRVYTTSGIQFNTGTVTSGTIQITDGEGGTILRAGVGVIEVASLAIGTPGASGAISFYDSGNLFGRMNVDEFYFQNTIAAGLTTTNGGQFLIRGSSSPNAPAANSCILYTDVVSGTVRLLARFPTGAAQVIAQQP